MNFYLVFFVSSFSYLDNVLCYPFGLLVSVSIVLRNGPVPNRIEWLLVELFLILVFDCICSVINMIFMNVITFSISSNSDVCKRILATVVGASIIFGVMKINNATNDSKVFTIVVALMNIVRE